MSGASKALLEILESLPTHPRSGELLGALVRAERAGFERGLLHCAELQTGSREIDGSSQHRQAG
ncbi:MAG TPA: hypothetical protein VFX20_18290 [Steroidobacteraceae bacterium]|nr:hypothetical protein [Steroidobacteraceae bacterium]